MFQWIEEEAGNCRERIYGPLQTLMLFIEQVLGADQSCQDAVARGVSQRVGLGQSPCSLNNGPYCKARARLALSLVDRNNKGPRITEMVDSVTSSGPIWLLPLVADSRPPK